MERFAGVTRSAGRNPTPAARTWCAGPAVVPSVWLVAALLVVGGIAATTVARATETGSDPIEDAVFEQLLEQHPNQVEHLRTIDASLAKSKRRERQLLGYLDLLAERPGLREHEIAYLDVQLADTLLQNSVNELELLASQDMGGVEEVAHFDIIAAEDSVFAARMRQIERLSVVDDAILDDHIGALAFLVSNPDWGEPVFVEETEPTYSGQDQKVIAYVEYLRGHPPLYRAWRELYQHLNEDRALLRRAYDHWFWYRPRPPLRRAMWRYRLRGAQDPEVHRIIWDRRLYLGMDGGLAEQIWQHRLAMTRDPELRRHVRYLLHEPELGAGLAAHRRVMRGW